jgi:steroid 5-alpha reductase family enzyme
MARTLMGVAECILVAMSAVEVLLVNLGVVMVAAVALWLVSLRIRDVSIVDIAWGLLFVLIAWATFWRVGAVSVRHLAIVLPTTLWGVRLSGYLAWRNLGKGEDFRYRAMRERIGKRFRWLSLFTVFGLQALLAWIIAWPLQLGLLGEPLDGVTPLQIAGFALFAVGLFFEAVGDWQLARFKADPDNAGQVMDRGLWRYTRHPNYFGDFLVWWGLFALSLARFDELPRMGVTVVGPLLMSFLLVRVSGVALLEKSLERRPGYQAYIRRTSAFFPWPPRD